MRYYASHPIALQLCPVDAWDNGWRKLLGVNHRCPHFVCFHSLPGRVRLGLLASSTHEVVVRWSPFGAVAYLGWTGPQMRKGGGALRHGTRCGHPRRATHVIPSLLRLNVPRTAHPRKGPARALSLLGSPFCGTSGAGWSMSATTTGGWSRCWFSMT